MLLALLVDKETDSKKRKLARVALEEMTAPNIFRTALSGDFNEVGRMTLRLWDVQDRDPEKEVTDVEALKSQLRHRFPRGE